VEVDFFPADDATTTLVRLTHRDLPPDAATAHRAGREHYLKAADARPRGADPWLVA
jgi:hypothetical protein